MLAVGIDISKSKSVAAILNQDGSMHTSPFEFHHTQPELDAFIKYILNSNAALRKYCFEVMQALKLTQPQDDPVYLFLLKKEQEGKPYNVAKMAGVNKFLRIYYARAMETLKQQ